VTTPPLPLAPHERILQVALPALVLALAWRSGAPGHAATIALGAACYAVAVFALRRKPGAATQKLRLLMGHLILLWSYWQVEWTIPALGLGPRDAELLAIDRALFGATPGALLEPWVSPWLNDAMSASYFFYVVYFQIVVVASLFRPSRELHRLVRPLYLTFLIGMLGYYLVPARGPRYVYPAMFASSVEQGSWITTLNQLVVSSGSSKFDVFPSLHLAIGWTLWLHDRRHSRTRAWIALPWGIGLSISTVYLRYHYGIDLVAGALLVVAVQAWDRRAGPHGAAVGDPEA